jgi:hypothetical protein
MVLFVLSGFDRLRFRGESRLLNHQRGVHSYLVQQQILRKDFAAHAQALTTTLRQQTEAQARAENVPQLYLEDPKVDKEATARRLALTHSKNSGRVALLSCLEPCRFYRLRKNDSGLIELRKQPGRCLHYYHYFQHPRLGWCYVRLQSWFPFVTHIGLNGREWLCRQLDDAGIGYQRRDNLLVAVDNPLRAQSLLDEQPRVDWPALLADLVRPIHPLWSFLQEDVDTPYHWMTEQSEWATDYVFRNPDDLALWYPRWIRHGLQTLQCDDILRYFDRKVPALCSPQDVTVDFHSRDQEPYAGSRLKFWYKTNSLKMYDKEGLALRLEGTVNQPKEFRVFRNTERQDPGDPKGWHEMRKSVADIERRAEVGEAANKRLAESLASVATRTPLGKLLEPLGHPVLQEGHRRARALNPLVGADGKLLGILAQGDFLINGFRNRDVREALHGKTRDDAERRRQSAAVTRQLALLRAHGLITKVYRTHRYQLGADGKRIVTALLTAHRSDVTRLAATE